MHNYHITTYGKKAQKQYEKVIQSRKNIQEKLDQLKEDPRKALHAHKLRGDLAGKWSCYLGGDIRIIYEIEEEYKRIVIIAAGSHKIY